MYTHTYIYVYMYVKYVEFLTSFLKTKLHQIRLVLWKTCRYLEEADRREDLMTFYLIQVKFGHLRSFVWCRSKLAMHTVMEISWFCLLVLKFQNATFQILKDFISFRTELIYRPANEVWIWVTKILLVNSDENVMDLSWQGDQGIGKKM